MRDALVMPSKLEAKLSEILERKRSRDLAAAQRAAEYEAKRRAAAGVRARMPHWIYQMRRDMEEVVIDFNHRIRTCKLHLEIFDIWDSEAADIAHMETVLFINGHENGLKVDIHATENEKINIYFASPARALREQIDADRFDKGYIKTMLVDLLDMAL